MTEPVFSARLRELGRAAIAQSTEPGGYSSSYTQSDGRKGPEEQKEYDRTRMSPTEFALKYGSAEAASNELFSGTLKDPVAQVQLETTPRAIESLTSDSLLQLGSGLAQGTAGLANLAIRAGDVQQKITTGGLLRGESLLETSKEAQKLMAGISGLGSDASNYLLSKESMLMKQKSEAAAVREAPRKADINNEFEASDKTVWDHLMRIGKEALVSGETLVTDGAVGGKVTAEAVGSMVPSLLGSGGASLAAKGAVRALGLEGTEAGFKITTAITAGAVGAVEGQGAYNDVVNEIRGMSFEDLAAGSEEFNNLVANGVGQEDARDAVAFKAGGQAQLIQTPIAALMGLGVAKFEANPFAREVFKANAKKPLATALAPAVAELKPIALQTVEEAGQSGSGTITSNYAVQQNADKERELSDNVGDAIAKGAWGGLGASSIISSPGMFMKGAKSTAKTVANATVKAGEIIAAQRAAADDNKSPFGEKATSENIQYFDDILSTAAAARTLQQEIDAKKAADPTFALDPEAEAKYADAVNQSKNLPVELVDTKSEEFVARTESFKEHVVEGSVVKTVRKVVAELAAGNITGDAKLEAETFVLDQYDALRTFVETTKSQPADQVSELQQAAATGAAAIITNILFNKGLESASESVLKSGVVPATSRDMVNNPVGIDPEQLNAIDTSSFTPEGKAAVEVVKAINAPMSQELEAIILPPAGKPNPTVEKVRKEMLFTNKKAGYGEIPSFNSLISTALRGAFNATRSADKSTLVLGPKGQMVDAQVSFTRIRNLIQHQMNKHAAALEAMELSRTLPPGTDLSKEGRVFYKSLKPKTGMNFSSKEKGNSIYMNHKNPKLLALIVEDTNTGIRAYNALIEQFPEIYKGEKLELLPMPEGASLTPKAPKEAAPNATAEAPAQTETETQATEPAQESETAAPAVEDQPSSEPNAAADIQPESLVSDPIVDSNPVSAQPAKQPTKLAADQLDFDGLFPFVGDTQTTLAGAMDYLATLPNMMPFQRAIHSMIMESAYFKRFPNTVVRKATEAEAKEAAATQTKGWWDPVEQAVVLIEPSISGLLHESIHAVILEVLNQVKHTTYDGSSRPYTRVELAAKTLIEMSNKFVEAKPVDAKMAKIQDLMRALINSPEVGDPQRGQVLAVNEFIAYGLTNKSVQAVLKNTKYKPPEFERPALARRIIDLIKKLLSQKPAETMFDRLVIETHILTKDTASLDKMAAAPQTLKTREKDVDKQKPKSKPAAPVAPAPSVAAVSTPTPGPSAPVKAASQDKRLAFFDDLPDVTAEARAQAEKLANDRISAEDYLANPEFLERVYLEQLTKKKRALANQANDATDPQITSDILDQVDEVNRQIKKEEARQKEAVKIKTVTAAPAVTGETEVELNQKQKAAFIKKYEDLEKLLDRQSKRTDLTEKGKEKLNNDLLELGKMEARYAAYKAEQTATPKVEPKAAAPKAEKAEPGEFIYTKAEIDIRRQPEEDEGEAIREYSAYIKDPAWVKMMDDAYNNDTDIMSDPIFDDWFSERIVDLFIGDVLKAPMLDVEWVPSNSPGGPYLHFKTALEPSTAIKDVYVNPSPDNLDLFNAEAAPVAETKTTPTAVVENLTEADVKAVQNYEDDIASLEVRNERLEEKISTILDTFGIPIDMHGDAILFAEEGLASRERSSEIRKSQAYKDAEARSDAWVGNDENKSERSTTYEEAIETIQNLVDKLVSNQNDIQEYREAVAVTKGEEIPAPVIVETKTVAKAELEPKAKAPVVAKTQVPAVEPTPRKDRVALGSNLAKGIDGQVAVLQAMDIRPILAPDGNLIEIINNRAGALEYEVDEDVIERVKKLTKVVDKMMEGMNARLKENVNKNTYGSGKDKRTFAQLLKDIVEGKETDVDLIRQRDRRSLVWVDQASIEAGDIKYDDHLLRLALMAAVDYVMNTPNGGGLYKTKDILKALGLENSGDQLTKEMREVVNFGRNSMDTKEGLARHISDFWGVTTKNDVSDSYVRGFVEAMADEVIDYLQSRSLNIDVDKTSEFWMKKSNQVQLGEEITYSSIRLGDQKKLLGAAHTILGDVLTEPDADRHTYRIGVPIQKKEIQPTLKKDKELLLSDEKANAVDAMQQTAFVPAMQFLSMFKFFGANALGRIMGFVDLENDGPFMNAAHKESVRGKNASIQFSIDETLNQFARIDAYAEKNGLNSIDGVPIYYPVDVSVIGRFFMRGFNPAANKLAREMFIPNASTIDISQDLNSTPKGDTMLLWAAVGQALDRGDLKLEKLGLQQAANYAQSLVNEPGPLRDAVEAIKNKEQLGQKAVDALTEAMQGKEVEVSWRLLKALNTVAQYELAKAAGKTKLDVELAIELDGKTNGPITSAIQNNMEDFSPEFLALVRRGGFFIGNAEITFDTYSDFQQEGDRRKKAALLEGLEDTFGADLYEVTGSVWARMFKDFNDKILQGKVTVGGLKRKDAIDTASRAQILIRSLMEDLGEVSFTPARTEQNPETGEVKEIPSQLVIKRKGTKGPITQNLYGAGAKSIAAGMVNALFSMVYEEITDAGRNGDFTRVETLARKINKLADIVIANGGEKHPGLIYAFEKPPTNKKGNSVWNLAKALNSKERLKSLEQFEFAPEQFDRLRQAFQMLYVPTFQEALAQTVGQSVKQTNDLIVKATNTHADMYIAMVKKALDDLVQIQRKPLAERSEEELAISDKFIGKGNELSKSDVNKIMAKYRKFAPVIDTGKTIFDLTGGKTETTVEVESRRVAAREANKEKPNSVYEEPTFTSYSGALSGSRSGSKRKALKGAGVRALPATTISNADVFMITVVFNHKDMTYSVLPVHDGIEVGLKDLAGVSSIMNEAIESSWMTNTIVPILNSLEALYELKDELLAEGVTETDISLLEDQIFQLQDLADRRQAKIDALKTVQRTVDGAPGAGVSFSVTKDAAGNSLKAFSSESEMIDYLNTTVNKLEAQYREARRAKAAKGYIDHIETEPKGGSDLRNALRKKAFGGDMRALLNVLAEFITNPDQKLVYDQVRKSKALQEILGLGLKVNLLPVGEQSHYTAADRTLHLGNVTAETALHEIVHAATVHQLEAHYADMAAGVNDETNIERTKAVARLESLMEDFINRTFENGGLESHVKGQIIANLEKGTVDGQIAALQEFMAWSLSNEQMIARGKIRIASDPLSQARAIGKKVIAMMRRLLGFTSNKVFDNVLFNAVVLMNSKGSDYTSTAVLEHKILEASKNVLDPGMRKTELHIRVARQVTAFLDARLRNDSTPETQARRAKHKADYAEAEVASLDALSRAAAAGFDIVETTDIMLFKSMHAIFSMDLKLDRVAGLELQKMFEAVSAKLSPELFLKVLMNTTGPNATQEQEQRADRMYRAAIGLSFTDAVDPTIQYAPQKNSKGLSDRLALFLALSQASPDFRLVLEAVDFKSLGLNDKAKAKNFDELLTNTADTVLSSVNKRVIGSKTEDYSAQNALDVLTEQLLTFREEAATELENNGSDFLNVMNTAGRGVLEAAGRTAGDALQAAADSAVNPNKAVITTGDKLASTALALAAGIADLLVDSRAQARANQMTAYLTEKKFPDAVANFWAELRGINDDNHSILKFVRAAKQQIASVRQEFVEVVPKVIARQFSDEFNNRKKGESRKQHADRVNADWELMFRGFGQTDLGVLMDVLGESTTLNLFGADKNKKFARSEAMREAQQRLLKEAEVLGLDPDLTKKVVKAYNKKARQLGGFMANWKTGTNLLRSARAIAGLYNEDGVLLTTSEYAKLQKALTGLTKKQLNALTYSIDVVTSLEGMNTLDDTAQKRLRELVVNETAGVKYAVSYMQDLRKLELEKTDNAAVQINGYKGHMASSARRKYSVIVADDARAKDLAILGYVKLRDYKGADSILTPGSSRSYYFSANHKLATYNQGAMQTVQDTFFGIDPLTGQTVGPETTGELITGDSVQLLNRRMKNDPALNDVDSLVPIFDADGDLVGYEQMLAPDMIGTLNMSKNFADSLGKWSGRLKEEQAAGAFNRTFVDALKEKYDEDVAAGRGGEYIAFGMIKNANGDYELSQDLQKNKIWKESYLLIPKSIREYGRNTFYGPIMIRRDLINNALGFRSASVTDIFTGQTNMNEKLRTTIRDILLAMPFMGKDMFKYLSIAEEVIQGLVSEVKHIIVVKSGIVLAANAMSNIVQLASREVPLSYMVKKTKVKYAEIAQYKRNEELKIRLRADKLAATSKSAAAAIQSRIEIIEESEKRMSIWPMIAANQFTTISEGLTDVDKAWMDGKFVDWVEKKAGELPGVASTIARYAIVSKDTALYKGMSRAVQYSDFVSRSIYFDFLTQERGVAPDAAVKTIDMEFINYDLVDSRTRTFLESVGLTWFLNFKIRSIKIAFNIAKNNPASALLALGGVGLLGLEVGSVLDDNLISKMEDGSIFYSIGPGMVEAGWNLNIWNQLFGTGVSLAT